MLKPYDKQSRKAHPGPQEKGERRRGCHHLIIYRKPTWLLAHPTNHASGSPERQLLLLHGRPSSTAGFCGDQKGEWDDGWMRWTATERNGMERRGPWDPLVHFPNGSHPPGTFWVPTNNPLSRILSVTCVLIWPHGTWACWLIKPCEWRKGGEGRGVTRLDDPDIQVILTIHTKLKLTSKGFFCCGMAFKSHGRIVDATPKVGVWWCKSSKCHAL